MVKVCTSLVIVSYGSFPMSKTYEAQIYKEVQLLNLQLIE
jgi:hypothetical protein